MSEQFRKPPHYEPDDTTWPALLRHANEVAMDLRRALLKERAERAAERAELIRQIESLRKTIRGFQIHNAMQRREATDAQPE
jgi:hypothetical protein